MESNPIIIANCKVISNCLGEIVKHSGSTSDKFKENYLSLLKSFDNFLEKIHKEKALKTYSIRPQNKQEYWQLLQDYEGSGFNVCYMFDCMTKMGFDALTNYSWKVENGAVVAYGGSYITYNYFKGLVDS